MVELTAPIDRVISTNNETPHPEYLQLSPSTEIRAHHIFSVLPEFVNLINWRQTGKPPTSDDIFNYVLDQIEKFTIESRDESNTQRYLGIVVKDIYIKSSTEQYIEEQRKFFTNLVNLPDNAPIKIVVGPDSMCDACAIRDAKNHKRLLNHCRSKGVSKGEVAYISDFEQYLKSSGYREGIDYLSTVDKKGHSSLELPNITFIESLSGYKTFLETEEEEAS